MVSAINKILLQNNNVIIELEILKICEIHDGYYLKIKKLRGTNDEYMRVTRNFQDKLFFTF